MGSEAPVRSPRRTWRPRASTGSAASAASCRLGESRGRWPGCSVPRRSELLSAGAGVDVGRRSLGPPARKWSELASDCGGAGQTGAPRTSKHRPGARPHEGRGRSGLARDRAGRDDETAQDERADGAHGRPCGWSGGVGRPTGRRGPLATPDRREALHRHERVRSDSEAAAGERDRPSARGRCGPAEDAPRRATTARAVLPPRRQQQQCCAQPERCVPQHEATGSNGDGRDRHEDRAAEESRAPTTPGPATPNRHDDADRSGPLLLDRGHVWLAALHLGLFPRPVTSETRRRHDRIGARCLTSGEPGDQAKPNSGGRTTTTAVAHAAKTGR